MTGAERKQALFETVPVGRALASMALPTIMSQLIVLIYNLADTWFIGQTNDPYMVAASSLVLTIYWITIALANLFSVGGGTLAVRLLGAGDEGEARAVAAWSLTAALLSSAALSLICFAFMDPLLRLLGASELTIGYARQYLLFVVVVGAIPAVLSNTMSAMLRNVGYSREAGLGLTFGGLLNIALDPLFMFVLLPDGYQVMGAAIATMLSNVATLIYFTVMYRRVRDRTILTLPRRLVPIRMDSRRMIFSVGIPAAVSTFLYDLTNMVINRLSAAHGDVELAAMGIVLKVERLPLNVGIGICLGMVPLAAYNYAAKNKERMRAFFRAALLSGLAVAVLSAVLYRTFARQVFGAFIADEATVRCGTAFLRAHCLAAPLMFLSFHMVHFMQAIGKGRVSFALAVIRQLCLNIPILFLMDRLFGMSGIVWTQAIADTFNVIATYVIYLRLRPEIMREA